MWEIFWKASYTQNLSELLDLTRNSEMSELFKYYLNLSSLFCKLIHLILFDIIL